MDTNLLSLSIGFFVGILIDAIWSIRLNGLDTTLKLNILEHYHWAIVLLLVYMMYPNAFFLGLAMALFLDEMRHKPFAIGKDHFVQSTLLGILIVVIVLLYYLINLL